MKRYIYIGIVLLLVSCKEKSKPMPECILLPKIKKELTNKQLEKIKIIYSVFHQFESTPIDQMNKNISYSQDPECTIANGLNMVDAYQNYLKKRNNKLDSTEKREVYILLLARSQLSTIEAIKYAQLKKLTPIDAVILFSYFRMNDDCYN